MSHRCQAGCHRWHEKDEEWGYGEAKNEWLFLSPRKSSDGQVTESIGAENSENTKKTPFKLLDTNHICSNGQSGPAGCWQGGPSPFGGVSNQ